MPQEATSTLSKDVSKEMMKENASLNRKSTDSELALNTTVKEPVLVKRLFTQNSVALKLLKLVREHSVFRNFSISLLFSARSIR